MTTPNNNAQEWEKRFDERFKCIDDDCDGKGTIRVRVGDDEWEFSKCRYCHEHLIPMRQFIKDVEANATTLSRKEARREANLIRQEAIEECGNEVEKQRLLQGLKDAWEKGIHKTSYNKGVKDSLSALEKLKDNNQ